MTAQYLRKCELLVGSSGERIDLSALRIAFNVKQAEIQTPNYAIIRVFNLSDATSQKIQKEFTNVSLQAGYQDGPYGIIFIGSIKQVRRGRVDAITTYLDIFASDGDEPYNFGVVNISIAAGSTATDHVQQIAKAMGLKIGYMDGLSKTQLPRGKVLYGMGRDHLRAIAASNGCSYSIQNGELQMIPLDGSLPGSAVVLNAQTGMVGMPEQTEGGIRVDSLLNPNLKVGAMLQINNSDIQRALQGPSLQEQANFSFVPSLSDDGFYRTYVVDYEGDTRGQPWYSHITCLSPTGPVSLSLAQKGQA